MTQEQTGGHEQSADKDYAENLVTDHHDPLLKRLQVIIQFGVRSLAVLMTLVIIWGVLDVIWVIVQKMRTEPLLLLNINDILATFGAFLAVLIAIEIYINIVMYLRDDVIHVKLVVATALMAIARKVIIFDYDTLDPEYIWATAGVVASLGLTYWLVSKKQAE